MNANELAREICKSFETYINYLPVGSYDDVTENWLSTPEAKSLIAQLSGVGGMKWVKASERLPEGTKGYAKQICLRWQFLDNTQLRTYTINQFLDLVKTNVPDLDKVEWLDESPIPSGEQDGLIPLKIKFMDCWEFDKHLPESDRWLASVESIKGVIVVAPTKDKAFEEIMISLRVKAMYDSDYSPTTPRAQSGGGEPDDNGCLSWAFGDRKCKQLCEGCFQMFKNNIPLPPPPKTITP